MDNTSDLATAGWGGAIVAAIYAVARWIGTWGSGRIVGLEAKCDRLETELRDTMRSHIAQLSTTHDQLVRSETALAELRTRFAAEEERSRLLAQQLANQQRRTEDLAAQLAQTTALLDEARSELRIAVGQYRDAMAAAGKPIE